jgi:hypothetical protein
VALFTIRHSKEGSEMRMSTIETDPGYGAWVRAGRRARVFLDGVEQHHCSVADEEAGIIVRCKLDSEGNIYAVGDEIAMEEVQGVVRIEALPV